MLVASAWASVSNAVPASMSGPGFGPMFHENRQEEQKAMDVLCPGCKLDEFDLIGP